MIADISIIIVLAVILGWALMTIKKEKKNGVACIGCPDAGNCAKRRNGESCE